MHFAYIVIEFGCETLLLICELWRRPRLSATPGAYTLGALCCLVRYYSTGFIHIARARVRIVTLLWRNNAVNWVIQNKEYAFGRDARVRITIQGQSVA